MSDTVAIAWFATLFGMGIMWLILIAWTFRRLRVRHVATYDAIGSPSLFWNNSLRNNWLFIKFLFQQQWQRLVDPELAAVARFMQILFVVYMAGFIGLVAVFLFVGIEPA